MELLAKSYGESKVRFTGKIASMEPKAIAQAVHDLAHTNFRLRVLTTDRAHIGTTTFFRDIVRHALIFFGAI